MFANRLSFIILIMLHVPTHSVHFVATSSLISVLFRASCTFQVHQQFNIDCGSMTKLRCTLRSRPLFSTGHYGHVPRAPRSNGAPQFLPDYQMITDIQVLPKNINFEKSDDNYLLQYLRLLALVCRMRIAIPCTTQLELFDRWVSDGKHKISIGVKNMWLYVLH